MEVYLEPIRIAFLVFPLIALLITLPYLIFEYHKYGAIPFLRSVIVYTFVLYLINAFFLVILPLPSFKEVSVMKSLTPQLELFSFVKDIMNGASFSSVVSFFKSTSVYTVLFNIVLTLPFGIYLRYYFNKKWYKVLLYSLGLSLFFEITQLTGIYGIYPKAYRLFDVDDLLINTIGGMIGFLISPLITVMLPTRSELDERSYKKSQDVSIYRRGVAFFIDLFFFSVILLIISVIFNQGYSFIISYILYFIIGPTITLTTIGKRIVNLKISSDNKKERLLIFLRTTILYLIIFPTPYYISFLNSFNNSNNLTSFVAIFLIILLLVNYLYYFLELFLSLINKRKVFFYERVSKTKNNSTIHLQESQNVVE